MKRNQSVTLSAELMLVNGIPFFITVSHTIKFITYLINKYHNINPVIEAIKYIKSHDADRSFPIKEMWIGRQCEPDYGARKLLQISLNNVYKDEQFPEIERINLTIKEKVCATYNDLNRHLTNISVLLIR